MVLVAIYVPGQITVDMPYILPFYIAFFLSAYLFCSKQVHENMYHSSHDTLSHLLLVLAYLLPGHHTVIQIPSMGNRAEPIGSGINESQEGRRTTVSCKTA